MPRDRAVRQLVRWGLGLVLVAAGLFYLNFAVAHVFLSPAANDPHEFGRRAIRYGLVALTFFLSAVGVLWVLKERDKSGIPRVQVFFVGTVDEYNKSRDDYQKFACDASTASLL